MRLRFRHYLAVTTVGTFALILLGVYTGKAGAGLSCAGRWPLCDGWMGLFPATWPSFIEWFHRLVAMVMGFMILGSALLAWWKGVDRRITFATGLATVLLPVQIIFGANTVLNFGVAASMAHQIAAQLIFAALVVATTIAFVGDNPSAEQSPADATAGVDDQSRAGASTGSDD